MMYTVIVERGENGWGAYVPDLPALRVAVAPTRELVEDRIREAIPLHVESMRQHGEPVPEPSTIAVTVEAPLAEISVAARSCR